MPDPVHIAAIDAGSNAVRLSVVRAYSAMDIEPLHNERYPLRLGEGVFVRNRFSEEVFKKAIKAFRALPRSDGRICGDALPGSGNQRIARGGQSKTICEAGAATSRASGWR